MPKKNGFTPVIILLVVLAAIGIFLIGRKNTYIYSPTPNPTPLKITTDTTKWKTYVNSIYNYSFKYPNTATIYTFGAGEGLVTATSKATRLSINFSNTNSSENIEVDSRNYFAPVINYSNWDLTNATINEYQVEIYKNQNSDSSSKLLYRFKNQNTETQVDFIVSTTTPSENILGLLSTFKFTK